MSTLEEKINQCSQCEFLIGGANICRKCGCFVPFKIRVPFGKCPIGKWDNEKNDKTGVDTSTVL